MPRLLVLGGTGAVGAGVAHFAATHGFSVTATGRRSAPEADLRARLVDEAGAAHVRLDLAAPDAEERLGELLDTHDLVVSACEPWAAEAAGGAICDAWDRLYATALAKGFDAKANRQRRAAGLPPRRIVRLGSCAAELPHALIDAKPGWPEDGVPLQTVEALAARDPVRGHGYFRVKLALARSAERAVRQGLDLVTAMPTWVLSEWGDRGEQEPLVQAMRAARTTGLVPAVPLNAIPVDVAAAGILLVGLLGETGEAYQIAGVETDTCSLHALSLRHLGLQPRALPVPRAELMDEMRLLAGRSRGHPLLDLCLLPWDATRRIALRSYGVEAWHLAVLLEGVRRSDGKLRALVAEEEADAAPLRLPEPDEIHAALAVAGQRKAERLRARGTSGTNQPVGGSA